MEIITMTPIIILVIIALIMPIVIIGLIVFAIVMGAKGVEIAEKKKAIIDKEYEKIQEEKKK